MKYRVEHIRWIPGQGISYNEAIGNEDSILTADQLRESYGSYCEDGDWLELIDNENDQVVVTTEDLPKKYWLDCDSNEGTQFALYEKVGEDETCILKFDFEDIEGLKELDEAGKIGEGYELIDKYIKQELGFLPEYEVG
jgi:hypothetical protein